MTSVCDPPGSDVGEQRHLTLAVQPIDRRRAGPLLQADDVLQPDGPAVGRSHRHLAQPLGCIAKLTRGPEHHIVLIIARVERRDLLSRHQHVHGLGHVSHANADVRGSITIDFDANLRFARQQRPIRIDDVRMLPHGLEDLPGVLVQLVELGPDEHVLNAGIPESASTDGRNRLHRGREVLIAISRSPARPQ